MTISSEIPITDTYDDVRKLIYKLCYNFHIKSGIEFEELVAEANLAFLKAYKAFNPKRGAFTTLLYWSVVHHLQRIAVQRSKRSKVWKTNLPNSNLIQMHVKIAGDFNLPKFTESLSRDGKFLVELIFDGPNEIGKALRTIRIEKRNWRKILKIHLKTIGWSGCRISKSFREVREAL